VVIGSFLLEENSSVEKATMPGNSRALGRPQYLPRWSEVVRTAITQELRSRYSVPEDLPEAMFTLVNQLEDRKEQAR
jgi:hypothetical protein